MFTADYWEGLLELLEWRWAQRGSRRAGRTRPSPRLYLEIEKFLLKKLRIRIKKKIVPKKVGSIPSVQEVMTKLIN